MFDLEKFREKINLWASEKTSDIDLSLSEIPAGIIQELEENYPGISFDSYGSLDIEKYRFMILIKYTDIVFKNDCAGIWVDSKDFSIYFVENGQVYNYYKAVTNEEQNKIFSVIKMTSIRPIKESTLTLASSVVE